jgi:hypothetical protein
MTGISYGGTKMVEKCLLTWIIFISHNFTIIKLLMLINSLVITVCFFIVDNHYVAVIWLSSFETVVLRFINLTESEVIVLSYCNNAWTHSSWLSFAFVSVLIWLLPLPLPPHNTGRLRSSLFPDSKLLPPEL